jgi:thiol-disulfide isomerase/thioredoxin
MRGVALVVAALMTLAGCGGSPGGDADNQTDSAAASVASFVACPASGAAAATAAAGRQTLPDLSLPCFAGGTTVALRGLGQPTVINLWASWCEPCRAELPELQRLADRAGGAVTVLGVVTNDSRPAAASLAADLGVSFPAVFDGSSELQHSVGPQVLPMTLFVDASGVVRHLDVSGALDLSTLEDLVRRHLGVVLA